MEAQELRIGNLVYAKTTSHHKDAICSITGLTHKGIYVKYGNGHIIPTNIEPILLTEEWLLQIGFVYQEENQWFELNVIKEDLDKDIYGLSINSLGESNCIPAIWIGNLTENISFDVADCKCTYVHQIQNLYFALTGKELQIIITPNHYLSLRG